MILDLFAGPGGWDVAAARLGIREVLGIELDASACLTRSAVGLSTIRADVATMLASQFAGRLWGLIGSPPCIVFSAAGKRAGVAVTAILAEAVRDIFAGRKTRARRRQEMARALRAAWWPNPKMTRAERSAAIWKAVRSASLVLEPARFIYECRPEWVALEQVPAVLPLWEVYAAELRKLGYSAWAGKVNAANYGVAQTRERAILIASRTRRVARPEPTHYSPRKGMQLWGEPWVTMADALGWGADGRPSVAVTAGGTSTGGAEPFGNRGRSALEAERDEGRWVLRRQVGASLAEGCRDHELNEPAPTITGGGSAAGSGNGAGLAWTLRRSRGASVDRRDHPLDEPAPTITGAGGKAEANLSWVLRTSFGKPAAGPKSTGTGSHGTHEMNPGERPAHAVTTKAKDWVMTQPGREDGEARGARDSVRITVQEAAVLQSFPPDYPWQGTKTAAFTQVGNAVPPLLAEHVLSVATGIRRRERDAEAGAA